MHNPEHRSRQRPASAQRIRRAIGTALAIAALLSAGLVVQTAQAAPASATNAPLSCDPNTIYGIDTSHAFDSIDVQTGAVTRIATMPDDTNALGISDGGGHAYAYSTATLDDYDASTQTVTARSGIDGTITSAIRASVDPANGLFYYATSTATSNGVSTIQVGAYDPGTSTTIGKVATISTPLSGSGGDIAFSKSGTMFVLIGTTVARIDQTVPTTAGNATLSATTIATISGISSSPGLAFASSGYLYVTSGSTLYEMNPITGAVVGSPIALAGGYAPQDLGGCTYPDSVAAGVSVSDRVHSTDQFSVAITGGGWSGGTPTTATTTGTATGLQAATVGPLLALGDGTYTVTQTMASGSASDYATSYSCTTSDGGVVVSGSGASATFTPPSGSNDVTCRFTDVPKTATIAVTTTLSGARSDASDQWTVGLHADTSSGSLLSATTNATTTGSGSTVDSGSGLAGVTTVVADRGYAIVDALASGSGSSAGQYTATMTCTDANGVQTGLPNGAFTGTATITPVAGAAIACTVDEAPRAAGITVTAALGSTRFLAGDQVGVAIRSGGPAGTVLDDPTDATTTGSGSLVTAGSGTTGTTQVTAGTAYWITAAPTAHAGAYTQSLTCTDATGLQPGLPSGAPFTGSASITPVAGADIACTVTTTLQPAALTAQITGPSALGVGAAGTWNVVVSNGGGASASGTVAVRLPARLAYDGGTGTGWSCTTSGTVAAGQLVTCSGPALTGGTQSGFAITATPQAGIASTVSVPVAVDPAGGTTPVDPATCTGAQTPTSGCAVAGATSVGSGVLLRLDAVGPTTLVVGEPVAYSLTVANTGTGPAGSATVRVELPVGMTAGTVDGGTCTVQGRELTCGVPGPIAAGDSAVLIVHVTPTAAASGTTAVLRGTVDPAGGTPAAPDACTGTDHASGCAVTSAGPVASGVVLAVGVTGPAHLTQTVPGDYIVTVADTGTGPASTPVVALALPDGLTVGTTSGADCVQTARVLDCALPGTVPAGGTVSFGLRLVPASSAANGTVVVTAAVDGAGGTPPADPASCTASTTCASTAADLHAATLVLAGHAVPIAPAGASVVAGDRIAYTYTVRNSGSASVDALVVTMPGIGALRCAADSLAAGAATTCTAPPVTVPQRDVDLGAVQRTATAVAALVGCTTGCRPVDSNEVSTITPARMLARIAILQRVHLVDTNGDGVGEVGETIRFAVTLTNTGTVTLGDVQPHGSTVRFTCPAATLAPGASMTCTGRRTVTAADVRAGGIVDTVDATGAGTTSAVDIRATSATVTGSAPTGVQRAALATTGSASVLPAVGVGTLLLLVGIGLLIARRRTRSARRR